VEPQVAVRVGRKEIPLDAVFEHARVRGDLEFLRDAARTELLQQAATKLGVKVSADELQRGADAFRMRRGLYTAEATEEWLRSNGATILDLERVAHDEVLAAKLRHALTDADVEGYFDEHRKDFDLGACTTIVVDSEAAAAEIHRRVTEGGEGFHAVRKDVFHSERERGGSPYTHTVELWRCAFPEELRDAVFEAGAGSVIGPLQIPGAWLVALVEYTRPAVLGADVVQAIQARLFEEWLKAEEEELVDYPILERSADSDARSRS
jgi:hypothetical protein